ncbi:MAG: hypothetical protein EAZ97_09120 [Bacteroidetes bacterium]|nr:MAG: hypothetical protein EAZ97_09120 [Bacteroidota bacterium]
MEKSKDLWGELETNPQITNPYTILKAQAKYLGNKTKNVIEAYVEAMEGKKVMQRKKLLPDSKLNSLGKAELPKSYIFGCTFYIVAPFLNNFTSSLLSVYYNQDGFPCALEYKREVFEISDQEHFEKELLRIFSSGETQKLIQILIAQSS